MFKKMLVFLVALAPSLSAEIEFAGVFYLGGEGTFSLVDAESGRKSGWFRTGQEFEGYRIESYDRMTEVLYLASPEDGLELKLRASVVKAERITIHGNLKIGAGANIEIKDAVLVVGEEMRFPIDERTWLRVKVDHAERGLPPGASAPVVEQGGAPLDGSPRRSRPEAESEGARYLYTLVFEEKSEGGEISMVAAPRVTALPGHGFAIQQDKYAFTYEP